MKEIEKSFNERQTFSERSFNKRVIEIDNSQSLQLSTSDQSSSQSLNASRRVSSMRNIKNFNEISSTLRSLHAEMKDVSIKDVEFIYTNTYTQKIIDLHTRTKIDSLQRVTHLHIDMKDNQSQRVTHLHTRTKIDESRRVEMFLESRRHLMNSSIRFNQFNSSNQIIRQRLKNQMNELSSTRSSFLDITDVFETKQISLTIIDVFERLNIFRSANDVVDKIQLTKKKSRKSRNHHSVDQSKRSILTQIT
jgi:hypothetical protein